MDIRCRRWSHLYSSGCVISSGSGWDLPDDRCLQKHQTPLGSRRRTNRLRRAFEAWCYVVGVG